jgi:dephospho-CoA kinase
MRVVFVAGMPGAGKSEAVRVFSDQGLSVVNMGDVVRDEARRLGRPETPASLGEISISLRKEYGEEEIARRCSDSIKEELSKSRDVVVEGVRSLEEVKYFKKVLKGEFYIVAIHSSPSTRYRRLQSRGRGDDPQDRETFVRRDHRELGYGMGSAIALADQMVVNEGSLEDFRRKVTKVYNRIIRGQA